MCARDKPCARAFLVTCSFNIQSRSDVRVFVCTAVVKKGTSKEGGPPVAIKIVDKKDAQVLTQNSTNQNHFC